MNRASTLLLLALLGGCSQSDGPEVLVEIAEDGSCSVREVEMACAHAPTYLRDVARVPFSAFIAVTNSSENASYQTLKALVESLKAVGYKTVIGSIELQPNTTMEPTR